MNYLSEKYFRRLMLAVLAAFVGAVTWSCSGGDSTRPTIVSTTPTDGSTSVEVSDPVRVVFSESMNPATMTSSRFILASAAATVSTSLSYDEASNTATIYHAGVLDYSTTYTVTVSGLVADSSGNPMGTEYSFSFTTASPLAGSLSWSNPLPQGNDLNGVWSISSSDIFAVGKVGTIVRSNGTAWTVMDSNTNLELNAVWGSSATDVYAVGMGGVIMRYDGSAWSQAYIEPEGRTLWCIWGSSASDVFVGSDDVILHFDGATWSEMTLPMDARITSIWGFSANEVYASAMNATLLRYNGSGWSVFEDFAGSSTLFWALWGASASDIFTGGYSTFGTDFLYRYDGSSWTEENVSSAVYAVWGAASNNVYAAGPGGYMVHYDGSTWSDESRHMVGYRSISGTSASDIYAVGGYGLIEHNDGSTWEIQNGTYIWSLNDIWGTAPDNIYAVGDYGAVLHYDGAAWERLDPLADSRHNLGISGTAANNVFVVNCLYGMFGFDGGDIYKYNGAAWTAVVEDPATCFTSVWAANDGNIFAVGFTEEGDGRYYRSSDDGATWNDEALGRMERAMSVSGSSSSNVIVVGGKGFALKFDGTSWTEMNTGTSATINSVLVLSDTEAYAVDENGLFFSYDGNASLTWTLVGRVSDYSIADVWGTSGSDLFMTAKAKPGGVGGNNIIVRYDGNAFTQTESIAGQDLKAAWGVTGDEVYFVGSYGVILTLAR